MHIECVSKEDKVALLGQLRTHTVFKYIDTRQVHRRSTYLVLQQQCHYFENVHKANKRMVLDLETDAVCQHDMDQPVVICTYRLIVTSKGN